MKSSMNPEGVTDLQSQRGSEEKLDEAFEVEKWPLQRMLWMQDQAMPRSMF